MNNLFICFRLCVCVSFVSTDVATPTIATCATLLLVSQLIHEYIYFMYLMSKIRNITSKIF